VAELARRLLGENCQFVTIAADPVDVGGCFDQLLVGLLSCGWCLAQSQSWPYHHLLHE
jgi:hypothetical protein